ncbi:MAG: hypothetical protein GXO78_06440 [Calditrichaeota bacterium]|nr:hypothetical protein [Calditrichota bacterium]
MRIPKLNFKDQKWLYFFIGSLFTALLAGGLVYFDVYNVLGRSTLRSDPTFLNPALEADSWAKIYGGITANSTGDAESGLIVLGGLDSQTGELKGKVGIGFPDNEVPQSMLDVKGDVKVDVSGTNSTSGLIVIGGTRYGDPIGRVGIGLSSGETPSAMLEVKGGNLLLHEDLQFAAGTLITPQEFYLNNGLRFNKNAIEHYETSLVQSTVTYWRSGSCSCRDTGSVSQSQKSKLASSVENGSSYSLAGILNKIFFIPSVSAVASCYPTQQECKDADCDFCGVDYTFCTSDNPYACSDWGGSTCPPGEKVIAVDAQCDSGDTVLESTTGDCYGVQYVEEVRCQKVTDSNTTDWFPKIEFAGSPATNEPTQTIIHDDLVANNNKPSNCGWVSATQCSDGKFMAGYNSSNNQIYCCDL